METSTSVVARVVLKAAMVSALTLVLTLSVCRAVYGGALANPPAAFYIWTTWFLVAAAVGDQILKNFRSGRAADQLAWNTFLSNLVENMAWVLLSHATGDPIYLVSHLFGITFDQFVLWQMIASSRAAARFGPFRALLLYASMPFLLVLFSLVGVPYFFPEIRSPAGEYLAGAATLATWGWSAVGWGLQIHRNWKVGVLTGRDFSLWIPVLLEISLLSGILNELLSGTNRAVPYLIFSVGLVINTILMTQCLYYWRRWREGENVFGQAPEAPEETG